MTTVYLTRRNLRTLLSKLDRARRGDETARTLIKCDTRHPRFPCSDVTVVIAVEDDDYYTDRNPGEVDARDR